MVTPRQLAGVRTPEASLQRMRPDAVYKRPGWKEGRVTGTMEEADPRNQRRCRQFWDGGAIMGRRFRSQATLEAVPGTGDREKTVVVLGAFRGGTSMVAGALKALGVFMGERFSSQSEYDNEEDLEFSDLLHNDELLKRAAASGEVSEADFGPLDGVNALVRRRNEAHWLWGWKYPGTVLWLLHTGLAGRLRNPHFVTVFRDPLAVCQHELDVGRISRDQIRDPGGISFRWVSRQIEWLADHAMRCGSPHLLVSYERAIAGDAAKAGLIDDLIRFLQPALGSPRRDEAITFVGRPRKAGPA